MCKSKVSIFALDFISVFCIFFRILGCKAHFKWYNGKRMRTRGIAQLPDVLSFVGIGFRDCTWDESY